MTVSESLKRFRRDFKITQKQVASSANVAERLYQKYEYGEVVPSVTFVMNLAENYDVSTDYLLGLSDNPKRL